MLLEDSTRFDGELCGDAGSTTGEIVFNTAMAGYQEAVTDPSYAGQIITFTYPMVGNYGVSSEAMESDRAHARAVIMREARNYEDAADAEGGWLDWLQDCGVGAITGVDTRALVRHIRERGAMRGGVFAAETTHADALETVLAEPPMDGGALAQTVSTDERVELDGRGPHVVALDTGIKLSIVRQLRERDCRVTLVPCASSAAEILDLKPNLVLLANGPGDPRALASVIGVVGQLLGRVPVAGICLGHQLLCRALGLETYKLRFGHRGVNHPVKDLRTGRIDITSQNHGFAVRFPGDLQIDTDRGPIEWETQHGPAELSHLNLYDGTVEGVVLDDIRAAGVQYHPEAGPGPHDSRELFDRFLAMAA